MCHETRITGSSLASTNNLSRLKTNTKRINRQLRAKRRKKARKQGEMLSRCGRRVVDVCTSCSCLSKPEPAPPATATATSHSSRSDFVGSAISALFPNSHFTNHESLPPCNDAFSTFTSAFPCYTEIQAQADLIRDTEYHHLSNHICLDYSGVGLFSHSQMSPSSSPSSSFTISPKSSTLNSVVQYGEPETTFESSINNSIMTFLNISAEDYAMVCTANRTTAFALLAETYPFKSNKLLLTVYDYESEAIAAMAECAKKKGARVMSASFSWPDLVIHSSKLNKILRCRNRKRKRGLFVFPLMSRMTGVRYPYLWMKMAQDNGWHVVLDACTLCPKDMDTMGITLLQPDFIICSFFKVFGENPSGFASLFIRKSSSGVLENSAVTRSIGVVSIVRASNTSPEEEMDTRSFSGPLSSTQKVESKYEEGETSEIVEEEPKIASADNEEAKIDLRGLRHADLLGLLLIQNRLRCITNWLVIALMKLRYPSGDHLVRIYGPRVDFDRGSAIAFNVFDWNGDKVEPALVQKLAGRSNISLNCGFLHNIWLSYHILEHDKHLGLEKRTRRSIASSTDRRKESSDVGIAVVSASLGFLVNFEDVYGFWSFVAKFLDADFVEKERWRYVALNQKSIEI